MDRASFPPRKSGRSARVLAALAFTMIALGAVATGCPFSVETFHRRCEKASDCKDGVECTDDKCVAGLCENPPKTKGIGCGPTKAEVCDGKGECVECLTSADCMQNHAMRPVCDQKQQKCVACNDQIQNGEETDVDCGGPDCGACLGQKCDPDRGCGNGALCALQDDICCSTSCDKKCEACVKSKTGVDDGTCAPVPYQQDPDAECTVLGSCGEAPGACRCEDQKKNADETDVDCGGTTCQRCTGGKQCNNDTDCAANVPNCVMGACCTSLCDSTCFTCNAIGQCVSQPVGFPDPTCPTNQACGPVGTTCVGKFGAACTQNGKCLSGVCATTCQKGVFGKPCSDGNDCVSGTCQSYVCM